MTKSKLLTAALIAAAMLATPVLAQEYRPSAQRLAEGAYVSAEGAYASAEGAYANAPYAAPYIDGRFCTPAPRVGAFATQPWDNENAPCEPSPAY
jgi:hypothetical protein